ncbi:MAG: tetratricopeptide repeat protein [Vicingaceae bacterium]
MAKKKDQEDEVIVDIEEVYSKSEEFVEKYKKQLTYVVGGIGLVIAGYFAYTKLYLEPLESEAQSEMFKAEQYFRQDSLEKAINGDGVAYGFVDILDFYGGTKSANLAHYYLGIAYLRQGLFEDAIDELEEFSSDDVMLTSIAEGAQGDAYMELGDKKSAVAQYMKAAEVKPNGYSSPIYLIKAGQALESMGEYKDAVEVYESIKEDYPESQEGRDIDKYIARASSFVN